MDNLNIRQPTRKNWLRSLLRLILFGILLTRVGTFASNDLVAVGEDSNNNNNNNDHQTFVKRANDKLNTQRKSLIEVHYQINAFTSASPSNENVSNDKPTIDKRRNHSGKNVQRKSHQMNAVRHRQQHESYLRMFLQKEYVSEQQTIAKQPKSLPLHQSKSTLMKKNSRKTEINQKNYSHSLDGSRENERNVQKNTTSYQLPKIELRKTHPTKSFQHQIIAKNDNYTNVNRNDGKWKLTNKKIQSSYNVKTSTSHHIIYLNKGNHSTQKFNCNLCKVIPGEPTRHRVPQPNPTIANQRRRGMSANFSLLF